MDLSQVLPQNLLDIKPEEFADFSRLDTGKYQFVIEKVEPGTNDKGDYLRVQLQIVSEHSKGRKMNVFYTYSAKNSDGEKNAQFGVSQLQQLHYACGLTRMGDVNQLIGKTLVGHLTYKLLERTGKQHENVYWMNGQEPIALDGIYTKAPDDVAPKQPLSQQVQPKDNPFVQSAPQQQQIPANQPAQQQMQPQAGVPFQTYNQ